MLETVHPRVCGELLVENLGRLREDGSSPRVRGTRCTASMCGPGSRFIPACAGNSQFPQRRRRDSTVHPRVCGELNANPPGVPAHAGSSPRVRGTLAALVDRTEQERFIPACAGNSATPAGRGRKSAVHPRVCGELSPPPDKISSTDGSSPRVRGTPKFTINQMPQFRFIPACAGNSLRLFREGPAKPGSSPRVRGTHLRREVIGDGGRFIPACAGNSSSGSA